MLNITQKLNITGSSQIDSQTAVRFWASIDKDNPEKLSLTHSVINGDLYRDNRDECEQDGNEFDDEVLAIQAQMEEQDGDVSNVEEGDTE